MKLLNFKSTISLLIMIFFISCCLVFYTTEEIKADSELAGKIVYVDLWTIFKAHPGKVAAEIELNQLAQSMQAELEEKAEGLQNDQKQELLREYQSRLTEREQELVMSVVDSIKDIIIQIAEEKEVRMVLEKTNVIYGGYDMTEDVITYIEQNVAGDEPDEETISEGITSDEDIIVDEEVIVE